MNWYWLLQLEQRERDGTGGECTPSFKSKETQSIPPSCSWTGTRRWRFSLLFLIDNLRAQYVQVLYLTEPACVCKLKYSAQDYSTERKLFLHIHAHTHVYRMIGKWTHGDSPTSCLRVIFSVLTHTHMDTHTCADTWRQGSGLLSTTTSLCLQCIVVLLVICTNKRELT